MKRTARPGPEHRRSDPGLAPRPVPRDGDHLARPRRVVRAVRAGFVVVAGSTVDTEKGPVQVEVTFRDRRITAVLSPGSPTTRRPRPPSPSWSRRHFWAQSADIDTVSGATVTSDGYKESLQAAIDAQGA
ncbi:FMN-binding protein [Streptomyces thinghirensis]|nr:FMN-binding protein [Streptomyces thinghirensis]